MEKIRVNEMISNSVHYGTPSELEYFKQFNIYKNLTLPCKNIRDSNIETTIVNLEVISAKIINTIQGISIEGQHLTGKKLVIIGNLNTKIIFRCPIKKKKLCPLESNIPFSTFIIIPNEICEEQSINLKYHIEDITTIIISKSKILISITMLMQYVDEY